MSIFSLAGEAVLITIGVVVAALSLSLLAVIIARIAARVDVDPLNALYVTAALFTILGAGIGMAKPVAGWFMRRRRRRR